LDALKDSWSKLKDELKASSADSEALLSLLEEAWIEIDELNSLLTQSIELSSTWKTISENLAHILDSQDKAHKKEILRLETERGWWIVGTVASSILAVGLGFAWLLK
jgi:predicted lipoprotein